MLVLGLLPAAFAEDVVKGVGLPIQGSDVAVAWDALYWFLIWLSVFFFILVVGGMIYFAVRYRSSKVTKTKYIVDHHGLEAFWTIVPTILLMLIFGWGWHVYKLQVHAPSNAMEIKVVGKQWLWQFQYDDGRTFTNELYVPVNKPVKLVMSSEDVLHSFFIPNFRVKSDVVPGMYTSVWFEAKVPGFGQMMLKSEIVKKSS
jgi:cytochrome c oxidase subunit 2